jgi:hypothetical protein
VLQRFLRFNRESIPADCHDRYSILMRDAEFVSGAWYLVLGIWVAARYRNGTPAGMNDQIPNTKYRLPTTNKKREIRRASPVHLDVRRVRSAGL